jgi:N-acetylglucosamine-6-phosphate deacetylase
VPVRPRRLRELSGILALSDESATVRFDRKITRIRKHRSTRFRDYLLPGFIDLQINGAHGIDVMAASAADLLRLAHDLAHEGTTAWLPTVITSPLDTIERCDAVIAEAMAAQREMERAATRGSHQPVGAMILGMHLEGPFVSPKRLGAHPPLNLLPRGAALDRILALDSLKLITLAPELDGALEAIPRFVRRGVTVSLGHTNADYDRAIAGLQAGATMFTHLFNAMPPFHHRAPGPIGAAAGKLRPWVTVIPDGVHVHYTVLRLCSGLETVFVTDRVAVTDADLVSETLFGQRCVGLYRDGWAARLADRTLAGSTITMLESARIMARDLAGGMMGAVRATSTRPACALRLRDRGRIAPRARADLILVDRRLDLKTVVIGGREID